MPCVNPIAETGAFWWRAPSSVAVILAVARSWSTSYVLGWRLRALHVDQLLVEGNAAGMEEEQGAVRTRRLLGVAVAMEKSRAKMR